MPRLSVCTITGRAHPRFREMANTLIASFRRASADLELEWIIIDDRLWPRSGRPSADERARPITEVLQRQPEDVQRRIRVVHQPPPATAHRGPDVADPLPAHNTAKNAALRLVSADSIFVVFLSDCTIVTSDWCTVAVDVAHRKAGWSCTRKVKPDVEVGEDMPLRFEDCHDNFKPAMASTVAGPCWGAPPDAFRAVGGFDESYDGEDDFHDHECLLRLGRAGLAFLTTRRAVAVRLTRTKIKSDITTRQGAISALRNRGYYNLLSQDKRRVVIPPTAGQLAGDPMAIARPGVAFHAGPASLVGSSAPALGVAPAPARVVAPIRYAPPVRPSQADAAAARAADDGNAVDAAVSAQAEIDAEAALPSPDERPRAQHSHEICAIAGDGGEPCILIADHEGGHVPGTPAWAAEYPLSTRVQSYRDFAVLATEPSQHAEASVVLDDLWYIMTEDERDEVDPEGAPARAAERAAQQPPPPVPVLSLHERAKAAEAARRAKSQAVAGGVAPPTAQGERCKYRPGQGTYKGQQCIKRVHGSLVPHQYETQAGPPPPAAQQPAAKRAPSREPPAPSEAVAQTQVKMTQHVVSVAQQLEKLPNDYGRQIILLVAALRLEGVLVTKEPDLLQMIEEAIPIEAGKPPAPFLAARQIAMARVREVAKSLPRPPCTPTEWAALAAHQAAVDQWRQTVGLQLHAAMTLFDRAHQAAADAGVDVWIPDDFRDAGVDGVADHERRQAQRATAPTVSVAPLSPEEAAAELAAAEALIADEVRRGQEPPGTEPEA